jgi:hypothetical protein
MVVSSWAVLLIRPPFADKSEEFIGNNDYWVVKLNANGAKQWDKTIGGSLSDHLTAIDTIGSNGYILAGYSNSPASLIKLILAGVLRIIGSSGWIMPARLPGTKHMVAVRRIMQRL